GEAGLSIVPLSSAVVIVVLLVRRQSPGWSCPGPGRTGRTRGPARNPRRRTPCRPAEPGIRPRPSPAVRRDRPLPTRLQTAGTGAHPRRALEQRKIGGERRNRSAREADDQMAAAPGQGAERRLEERSADGIKNDVRALP